MVTGYKPLLTILLVLVILAGSFFILTNFLSHPPYPSLHKQRAALKNKPLVTPFRVLDSVQIVDDLKFLSSDTCEGRGPGLKGHEIAINRILSRMREAGLDSFHYSLLENFSGKNIHHTKDGQNIIGWVKGTADPSKFIIISAHYDHLGVSSTGEIYHGASDNASGTACLLAMAKYFKQHPHPYSLIFAAFDREESLMEGSDHFVINPPLDLTSIKFNLNMDMIARNQNNELFACGVYHYPSLRSIITAIQDKTNTKILMGHDRGTHFHEDWTGMSDHYYFYLCKIPFLYIGAEDHPDLHKPTDTFDKIDLGSYIENCNLMVLIAQVINDNAFSAN